MCVCVHTKVIFSITDSCQLFILVMFVSWMRLFSLPGYMSWITVRLHWMHRCVGWGVSKFGLVWFLYTVACLYMICLCVCVCLRVSACVCVCLRVCVCVCV